MRIIKAIEAALGVIDVIVKWIVGGALLLMTAVLFFNSIARQQGDGRLQEGRNDGG